MFRSQTILILFFFSAVTKGQITDSSSISIGLRVGLGAPTILNTETVKCKTSLGAFHGGLEIQKGPFSINLIGQSISYEVIDTLNFHESYQSSDTLLLTSWKIGLNYDFHLFNRCDLSTGVFYAYSRHSKYYNSLYTDINFSTPKHNLGANIGLYYDIINPEKLPQIIMQVGLFNDIILNPFKDLISRTALVNSFGLEFRIRFKPGF